MPETKNNSLFPEITKPDPKLSKPFYLNKVSLFWLSYECFSIFCNGFLLKSVISSHNSYVKLLEITCYMMLN